MVPAPISAKSARSPHSLVALSYLGVRYALRSILPNTRSVLRPRAQSSSHHAHHDTKFVVFACLIPVLVLLSGIFAGLTLGYMSLDVTQLNVLSMSGSPQQRSYAKKIIPVRKNGHLLLVTLLLSNMIVNETLPIIMDDVLHGGVQTVIVSTVLIVLFAEIIPQSIFTRYGLYLGAKLAPLTQLLIYLLGIIAWPVAKLLELILGAHHGIIYRRAELKELIAMHSHTGSHGGDLKHDTVTIIGATLDLQEKVVTQAMTPIKDVFMLSIDSTLDFELLKKIHRTGHSRVPVYEEIDLPEGVLGPQSPAMKGKKIVGILLVKNCLLLDPHDAVPLRSIPLNSILFVPQNESLLGILDKFQEGRSHIAIVSRFSVEKAVSVKQAVKQGLTRRLRESVGMGDSDSSTDEEDGGSRKRKTKKKTEAHSESGGDTLKDGNRPDCQDQGVASKRRRDRKNRSDQADLEAGLEVKEEDQNEECKDEQGKEKETKRTLSSSLVNLPRPTMSISGPGLEQIMPADAVLAKQGAKEFLQRFDPAIEPLGIITLEDVLEELIGEEIYDEFDPQGARAQLSSYAAPTDQPVAGHADDAAPPPASAPTAASAADKPIPQFTHSAPATPIRQNVSKSRPRFRLQASETSVDGSEDAAAAADGAGPPVYLQPQALLFPEPPQPVTKTTSEPPATRGEGTKSAPPMLIIPHAATPPVPRSSSPSLEAILLDRKRRMNVVGGSAGGTPATIPLKNPEVVIGNTRRPASVKGKFKSTPLGDVGKRAEDRGQEKVEGTEGLN